MMSICIYIIYKISTDTVYTKLYCIKILVTTYTYSTHTYRYILCMCEQSWQFAADLSTFYFPILWKGRNIWRKEVIHQYFTSQKTVNVLGILPTNILHHTYSCTVTGQSLYIRTWFTPATSHWHLTVAYK